MGLLGNECFECTEDSHCSPDRPHCVLNSELTPALAGWLGGTCKACRDTADCAEGICSDYLCVSECTRCRAFEACDAGRCEPAPCKADQDCGEFGVCVDSSCRRQNCTSDDACGSGNACVGGACYPDVGTCTVIITATP